MIWCIFVVWEVLFYYYFFKWEKCLCWEQLFPLFFSPVLATNLRNLLFSTNNKSAEWKIPKMKCHNICFCHYVYSFEILSFFFLFVLKLSRVYELLHVLEFTSSRKRMSIIVRNVENQLLLLSKGADRWEYLCTQHLLEFVKL